MYASPPSGQTEIGQDWEYNLPPLPFDHEDLDQYCPGGYCPIAIGDVLGGRYQVVNKLGCGGFASVWLCRDRKTASWKAVKVIASEASGQACGKDHGEWYTIQHFKDLSNYEEVSKHLCIPEDYAILENGPNGDHLCLVLPLMGSDLGHAWETHGDQPDVVKDICAQMVRSMALLHSKGICHGDFRPNNMLFRMNNTNGLNEANIEDVFPRYRSVMMKMVFKPEEECEIEESPATETVGGNPDAKRPNEIGPTDGEDECQEEGYYPHLPSVFHSTTNYIPLPKHASLEVVVSDFGEAYHVFNPPRGLGIPEINAAPEILLGLPFSFEFATDIWALGVAICEVRKGSSPFLDGHMVRIVGRWEELLGPLPEPYRSVWTRHYGESREDTQVPTSSIPMEHYVTDAHKATESIRKHCQTRYNQATSLDEFVRREKKLLLPMADWEDLSDKPNQRVVRRGLKEVTFTTPPEEADQLCDLLSRIFKYSQKERLPLAEIMAHPWFDGRFSAEEINNAEYTRYNFPGFHSYKDKAGDAVEKWDYTSIAKDAVQDWYLLSDCNDETSDDAAMDDGYFTKNDEDGIVMVEKTIQIVGTTEEVQDHYDNIRDPKEPKDVGKGNQDSKKNDNEGMTLGGALTKLPDTADEDHDRAVAPATPLFYVLLVWIKNYLVHASVGLGHIVI